MEHLQLISFILQNITSNLDIPVFNFELFL